MYVKYRNDTHTKLADGSNLPNSDLMITCQQDSSEELYQQVILHHF